MATVAGAWAQGPHLVSGADPVPASAPQTAGNPAFAIKDYRISGNTLLPEDFVMEVIVDCGRPVLVVPYAGDFKDVGKRPMIAWNDAREAAHALNDALPLLAGSEDAWVLSFASRHEDGDASCAHVVRHLGHLKASRGYLAVPAILALVDRAVPAAVRSAAVGALGEAVTPMLVDTVATNVPGPAFPLWVLGRRVR